MADPTDPDPSPPQPPSQLPSPASLSVQGGPAQAPRNNGISVSPLGPPGAQQAPQQPSQTSFTPPTRHNPAWEPQHSPSLVPVQRQVLCETGTASTEITPETVDAELDGIPPPTLAKLKRRLGMAGRGVAAMTAEEKMRLVQLALRGTGTGMRSRSDAPPPGVGPAQQQFQARVTATRVVQHAHPRPPPSLYLPTMQPGQTGPMFDPPYPEFRDLHGFVIPSINPLHQYGAGAGLSRQMLLQTMHQQGPSRPQNLNPPQYQYAAPARAPSSSHGSAGGQWHGGQPRTAGPVDVPAPPHREHAYALRMPFATPTRSPPAPSASGNGTSGSGAPSLYVPRIPSPPQRRVTTGFQEPTAADPPSATPNRAYTHEDFERDFAAWFEPDGA